MALLRVRSWPTRGAIEEHSSVIYDNVRGLVVIFGFSDRVAVDIARKGGSKGGLNSLLLWYLPKEEFIGIINDVSRRAPSSKPIDVEVLWQLLGGNIRELAMLVLRYGWDVNAWLSSTVIRKVRDVIIHEVRIRSLEVNALLSRAIDPSPQECLSTPWWRLPNAYEHPH